MDGEKASREAPTDGLAGLLGIGLEADRDGEASVDERKEARLRAALAETLPSGQALVRGLPGLSGQLPMSDCGSIGQLLLDPETPLPTLQEVKDHGKRLSRAPGSAVDRAAATTIYFAAIASAMLFHDRKITGFAHARLSDHFGTLAEKRWMAPRLARHFAAARDLCCRKAE